MNSTKESWEKLFDPEVLRVTLMEVAVFILVFEVFEDHILEKPKTLFERGFDKNGLILSDKYKLEVLSLSRYPVEASLLWFKQNGGVCDEDIQAYNRIRKHRNEITHEMEKFLFLPNKTPDIDLFKALFSLFLKIEQWWFKYFEVEVNPDILPEGSDFDDVQPMSLVMIELMILIVFGDDSEEGGLSRKDDGTV